MRRFAIISQKLIRKIVTILRTPMLIHSTVQKVKELAEDMNETDVFVILPVAIGDFCYAMAYMDSFCEGMTRKGMNVTAFVPVQRKMLLECYSNLFNVVYLEKGEGSDLIQRIMMFRHCIKLAQKHRIYSTNPWFYPNHLFNIRRDGLDILRNNMLFVSNKASIAYPRIKPENVCSIPNFDVNKKRIVVMNPYSVTIDFVDMNLFVDIADFLRNKGYIVFTNVVADQKVVPGTEPLNCSIFELYNICQHIPMFVSVRSGIVDLAISTPAQFFVVYFGLRPKMRRDFFHLYSLSAWDTGNATEVLYQSKEQVLKDFYLFYDKNKEK